MIIICVMDKGTEEKVSAAVLRLWMMNVAVVQLELVKSLESEIKCIDGKIDALQTERKAKILHVKALKLELVSYHLSVITLRFGRSLQALTLIEEKKEGGVKRESLAISNEFKNIIMNVFKIFLDFKKWYLLALACSFAWVVSHW